MPVCTMITMMEDSAAIFYHIIIIIVYTYNYAVPDSANQVYLPSYLTIRPIPLVSGEQYRYIKLCHKF